MSEITDDYYGDSAVQRVLVTAKAAKISGSGSVTVWPWVITEDSLPDELIDSDKSTADTSGAPTLRASTDEDGSNQIGLHIVDFSPASGGAGGGATAEIWLYTTTGDADNGQDVYLWWNKSGKTQPAAGATYGADSVYTGIEFISHDGGLTDSSPNHHTQTDTGTADTSTTKIGANAREHGSGDSMETPVDMDDATGGFTWMVWGRRPTSSFPRYIMAQWSSNNGLILASNGTSRCDVFLAGSSILDLTTLWTVDTFVHAVVTYDPTDGYVLYQNGSSVDTNATTTFPGFSSVTSGVFIGNRQAGSREWDGEIDEPWIIKATLDADQIATLYQNQNDPADFWDSTAAVERPFASGALFQWDFAGREYDWTIELFEDGVVANTTAIMCAGANMVGRWGFGTNSFDDRIRSSELKIEVIDPELALYNALVDTDNNEEDFTIQMTDSTGAYTLNMNVRLDEVATMLVDGLEQPVTTLYAYCGMANMDTLDAVTVSSATISELFNLILLSNGISQDIEYYIAHYAENSASSGALLDLHRLNRLDLIFAESGRKIDTMYDQLNSLAEGFGLIVTNGLDGKWHVKHEYALGDTVTDRGAQSYSVSGGTLSTLNTLSMLSLTLTNDIISRNTLKSPVRPVQAVQVERGNDRNFITVDLVKHGDFEYGWTSVSEHEVWTENAGSTISRSIESDTGTYAMEVHQGSTVHQDLIALAGKQDLDFEIATRFALRVTSGNGANGRLAQVRLRYKNIDPASPTPLNTYYGQEDGWTDALASFNMSARAVAAASTPVYSTFITSARGPLPDVDGLLDIELVADPLSSLHDLYVDTLEVRIKKGDDAKNKFISVSGRYEANVPVIKGDVVEQHVPWYNGTLGLDNNDNSTRDEVHQMLQVLTTAMGSWIQASQFRTFVAGYKTKEWDDLFSLMSEIRVAQQDETTEQIEGEVCQIVPHNYALVYGSKTYIQTFTEIDFKTEVTNFVARQKILGAAVPPSEPEIYFVGEDDDHFYTLSSDFATETDTGLNLTIYGIDDIDIHQATGTIYGLNTTTGFIYSWLIDGSSFSTFKDTGYTDLEGIAVDNDNDTVLVANRLAAPFEQRFYGYNLDASDAYNYENRFGTHSITQPPGSVVDVGGESFLYTFSGFYNLYRVSVEDGGADDVQAGFASGSWAQGVCIPALGVGYQVGNSAIYEWDIETLNNPTTPSTVVSETSLHLNADSVDYFTLAGTYYIVGCGGGKVWSWVKDAGSVTTGQSTANARCLCTAK